MAGETCGGAVTSESGIVLAILKCADYSRRLAISIAMFVHLPLAMSQEKERSATVDSGETVRIWFGANYGRALRYGRPSCL